MCKKVECKKGAPEYMLTFGDMMSLLLCFFILLVSMATFEPVKMTLTMNALQGSLGVLESQPTVAVLPIIKIPKFSDSEEEKKQSAKDAKEIAKEIQKDNLEDGVKVKVTETGIAVLLTDPVSFPSGSDQLNPKSNGVLRELGELLNKNPNASVRVEGHTDDVPINSAKFPSNWELSSARALAVVKRLAQFSDIDPGKLSAVGYGEYRPVVLNNSVENRQKNRRIEIYIDYTQKQASRE